MTSGNDVDGYYDEYDEYDGYDEFDDKELRALLIEALPDFPITTALGDRALAGAARRRARVRAIGLGGFGVVAAVVVGMLAVAPLVGWSGRGSDGAQAGTSPAASTTGSRTLPSWSPTSRPLVTSWVDSPKERAVQKVGDVLQSGGHDNSYMGVGLSGADYATGAFNPESAYDASPIVVYRKPVGDPTLERDALQAAAPFPVVFRDTVLDSSEQWFLGHRIEQDKPGWEDQGLVFATTLEVDGTITVTAVDPGEVVARLEQRYGYDGRVFVGRAWNVPVMSAPGMIGH